MRPVLVPGLLFAGFLIGAAIYGCSAPDPGSLTWDNSPSGAATAHRPSSTVVPTSTTTATTTTTVPVPTGDAGSGDAGPKPPTGVFAGAPAFVSKAPLGKSSVDQHGATGNAGMDCLQSGCHGTVAPSAPRFEIAGTVVDNGKTGVPNAEVRIVDSTGAQLALTNTDAVGNFWVKADIVIPAGTKTAVRNATITREMASDLMQKGGCNGGGTCHGGTSGPIKLN